MQRKTHKHNNKSLIAQTHGLAQPFHLSLSRIPQETEKLMRGCLLVSRPFSLDRFLKNLKNRKDWLPETFWQLLIILEWFNTLSVRESLRFFVSCACKLNMSIKTFAPFQ